MTKNQYRKVLNDFNLYSAEIFLVKKEQPKEYYICQNMLISFSKNKKNKTMYLKFQGEIPVALIEYIDKKYPENEIISLYSKNDENVKNCNVVLVSNLIDLQIFLKESKMFWLAMEKIEREFLELDKNTQIKKLIP